jgi:hypothetical protein
MANHTLKNRLLLWLRIDLRAPKTAPSNVRTALCGVVAALLSLGVNALLVKLGETWESSLHHFSHFRFVEYSILTVVGVAVASVAWSVTNRSTQSPRWLFFRMAIVVVVLAWIPDLWLLARHEPVRGVAILALMHVAVALLTYNILVYGAPSTNSENNNWEPPHNEVIALTHEGTTWSLSRTAWMSMVITVSVEFLCGLAEIALVPYDRPNGWIVHQGEAAALIHTTLGVPLGVGALAIYTLVSPLKRLERIGAVMGLWGVGVAGLGGMFTYFHSLRLWGMVLMFFGAGVAFFGYLIPILDQATEKTSRDATTPS